MSRRLALHFHGTFWPLLSVMAGCGDSGGPARPGLTESDGGSEVCETTLPTSCPSPAPTYEQDVATIIEARCSSCHDGRGEQWPLVDYSHTADWSNEIRAMVADCSMPPPDSGVLMLNSERQVILDWVRCGAPR
jgi:hypothetical protein